MKVLLVDDDVNVASNLAEALADFNFVVSRAGDSQAGFDLIKGFDFDLILLDIGISKIDGIDFCRKLRALGNKTPILLLAEQQSNPDKILGLDDGAHDYVVKPFDLSELLARIRALVRRAGSAAPAVLIWGKLQFAPSNCDVTYDGEILHLTPKESSILELLLRNPQRVFSRSAILDRLWSLSESPGEGTVTTHVKGLRQKLKAVDPDADPIETLYGLGYRLKPRPKQDKSDKPMHRDPQSSNYTAVEPEEQSSPQSLDPAAIAIWQQLQVNCRNSIALFKNAQQALASHQIPLQIRQQARAEAHKLIGSFGVFRGSKGSELARQIEQLFNAETDSISSAKVNAQKLASLIEALQHEIDISTPSQLPALLYTPHKSAIAKAHAGKLMLIVDDDLILAQTIAIEAMSVGFSIRIEVDLDSARAAIAARAPDIILLDLSFPNTNESGLTLLAEVATRTPCIPVLAFTSSDRLGDRVEAARLGAKAFLQKPINSEQVLQAVTQVLKHAGANSARVLVVDDDPLVLYAITDLLEPWGVQVTVLEQPQQFWQVLNTAMPELLVLDLEMPDFSGIDLCQVVRNDLYWGNLPILVLTARIDADTIYQIFAAGADDFVSKPIVGPDLVTRSISRIERLKFSRPS
jgi:DNA-binding response OmpR family regulator/HPt (histidine-containing phosphotransfer) domain-containing protein